MSSLLRALSLAILIGLALAAAPVNGQDNPPADPNFRLPGQAAQGQAPIVVPQVPSNSSPYLTPIRPYTANPTASLSSPYLGGSSAASLVNPNANSSGYNNPYYPPYFDPGYSALTGYANVISASAQAWVTIQNARIVQQQANQAELNTRRAIFDQIRYERMSMPTPEEIRVKDLELALNRARRQPPASEIFDGSALNSLLDYLIKQQGAGVRGPRVDLDEDMLNHINVAPKGTRNNIGLLKDGENLNLQLPFSMQRPEYTDIARTLNRLFKDAIAQVGFAPHRIDASTLKEIDDRIQILKETLRKNISDMTPSQYIEASHYVNQLKDGFDALKAPEAKNYFGANRKWAARGKTVAELVENMSKSGLKFAPATPGDETYYRALYNALGSFDATILSVARP